MPNNLSALLFCASKSPDQKPLPAVEKEREELKDIFLKMQNGNRLKLIEEDEYTSGDLAKRIDIVNKHQVLLHIGGHANGEKVLGTDGAIYVEGICESIRLGDNQLILAFINGCSSLEQAEKYFMIGGKVVIATTTAVEDFPAKDFAVRFYECLSQRDSIEQAFEKASALVKGKGYSYDSIDDLKIATRGSRSKDNGDDKKLPWRLVYQEENQEYLGWRIPLVSERLTSLSENAGMKVIGRETEIKELHSDLKNENRVVVHGLAGMGKSALAREYLKQYESEYKYTIWIDQNGTFKSSLAGHSDLCEKLKLNFTDENLDTRYAAMVKKLDEIGDPNYPSLLVVDNAEAELGEPNLSLPDSRKWKILATSRQSINEDIFKELKLDKLQPDKAQELFLRYFSVEGDENLKIIDQILTHIDYHPLTIECSAKSLAEGYSNLEEFYDNLKNFKLWNEDSYFRSVYTKQETSILQHLLAIFNGHAFSEEEKTLLIQLALMPSTDLPLRHLKVLLAGNAGFEKVLTKLDRLGWIAKVRSTSTQEVFFQLHRLIKEVIKYQFSKDEKTGNYDIRLLWQPAKKVIQNLIDNLKDKNSGNNFELLIYYFEINRVFGKHEVFDEELHYLHYQWAEALNSFFRTLNEFSKHEYAIFKHWLEIYPKESIVNLVLGIYFLDQQKWDETIAAFQKVIELDPNYTEAYICVGIAQKEKGELDKAINTIKRVIELDPKFADAYNCLGTIFFAKGQPNKAIHAYKRAIELDPKFANAYYNLSVVLGAKGELVGARDAYKRAIELDPIKELFIYGNTLYNKGEPDKAIEAFLRIIELNPKSAKAYYNIGALLEAKGDTDRAIIAYQEAININPYLAVAHQRFGVVLGAKGQWSKAIHSFKRVIELNPTNIHAYLGIGLALQNNGELDKAINAFKRAIELDPKFVLTYKKLGIALLKKGEWDMAIVAFKQAIKLNRQDPFTWFGLGLVQIIQNHLAEAKQSFLKGWQLGGEKEYHAAMGLGHIELLTQNQKEAMNWYLESVNLAENKEEFFQGMEANYQDLKMEEGGISQESYTNIIAQLRDSIGS